MITEPDIILDNLYETISSTSWFDELWGKVTTPELATYLETDYGVSENTALKLIEMYYIEKVVVDSIISKSVDKGR